MLKYLDVLLVFPAHILDLFLIFLPLSCISYSPVQFRWVVPCHVLPLGRAHVFPDSRGAPPGSVRWWHSHEQHQVPLQQQPNTGGTRHELGRVRQLEPGLCRWRNLWHRDQDGGIPVRPWRLHPQWCALPLLFQISTGKKEGYIIEIQAQKQLRHFVMTQWSITQSANCLLWTALFWFI